MTRVIDTVHCDADVASSSLTGSALKGVRSVVAAPENEMKRWRRIFEANAKVVIDGEKYIMNHFKTIRYLADCSDDRYLDPDSFVNAIAPKTDSTKIGRAQFAILFRVADSSKRGLVSWDDFTVFETLLKRPDADYWIAFQYFDV
jgi:solute carrier family 25 aspartate/glutamate transporter 12/13